MFERFISVSCATAIALLALPAHAADIDSIVYAPDLPVTKPVEIGTGWYLRGDLGYSVSSRGAATNYSIFLPGPPASYTTGDFATSELNSDWSGSIGAGYRFTDYFRTDLTFDYSEGGFNGTTVSASPCAGMPVGTTCASSDSADFTSYGFMANAYVDLGTFAGITPYVGAGAGMTKVVWDDLADNATCVAGGVACPVPATLATVTHPGEESWRFTYALMAGLSYSITDSLELDLGYRYQKVDSGEMFGFDSATVAAGATGIQAHDRGIEKHEIRAGLRYSLW